jgi:Ca-activated chloride channel family protein
MRVVQDSVRGITNRALLGGLMACVLIAGCVDETSTSTPAEKPVANKPTSTSYGSRGADASWPNMPEGAVATASNLLAKNYVVVLDASGSMIESNCTDKPTKLHEAKSAIMAFGESLAADANLGLIYFSADGIGTGLELAPYNPARLKEALSSIHAGGSTPLATAIDKGFDALTEQARSQLGNGQYNLVVVTDGAANVGQNVEASVSKVVNTSPVMIHAVGFCIDSNHALNQAGKTRYIAASDGESLRRGLVSVLAESTIFDVSAFSAVE